MDEQTAEQAAELARALHTTQRVPALALAVASPDGVLWTHACGQVDLELEVPAEPEHLFRLGSVSKVITAVAVARLASKGVLDLHAPMATWLPGLPRHHRETTLLQLLTHRGGVRHYNARDIDWKQPGGPLMNRPKWTNEQILEVFIGDPLVAEPGEKVSYSSFGYSLASIAMEAAAGDPFLGLVEAEVARPFRLESLVEDDPSRLIPRRARGYMGAEEMQKLQAMFPDAGFDVIRGRWANAFPINPAYCWAGAGFLMSVPDTARFGAAMLEGMGSPLTPEERSLLFTPLTEKTESSPPLGLGWRIDRDDQGRLRWHHAGATAGGRAGLVIYPDAGLSIALAGNTMTRPNDVLGPASALAEIFAN